MYTDDVVINSSRPPRTPDNNAIGLSTSGQRRRFDQITNTPNSMDTIENTDTHMNPPEWEGPSEWDEGNIVETARIINFDSNPPPDDTLGTNSNQHSTISPQEPTPTPQVLLPPAEQIQDE